MGFLRSVIVYNVRRRVEKRVGLLGRGGGGDGADFGYLAIPLYTREGAKQQQPEKFQASAVLGEPWQVDRFLD